MERGRCPRFFVIGGKMLRKIDRLMAGFLNVLGLGLLVMVGLSVYNVIGRYAFGKALLWADEIAVFAMIGMAYLGAIVCAWRGTEIRMGIIAQMLPKRAARMLNFLQQFVIAGLCLWVFWLSFGYVERLFRFGMTSDSSGIPIWTGHATITLSLLAMGLIALLRLVRSMMGKPDHADIIAAEPETGK